MRPVAKNQVIEKPDAENIARLSESRRERDVLRRRLCYATRVVVADDDRGGVRDDRWLEDLAGMNDQGSQRSDRDDANADHPMLGIEERDGHLLAVEAFEERPEELRRGCGAAEGSGLVGVVGFTNELQSIERRGAVEVHRSVLHSRLVA